MHINVPLSHSQNTAFSLDHHSKTGTAEIRDSAEENSKHWGHRTDLGCSKRGTVGSAFRDLEGYTLEI